MQPWIRLTGFLGFGDLVTSFLILLFQLLLQLLLGCCKSVVLGLYCALCIALHFCNLEILCAGPTYEKMLAMYACPPWHLYLLPLFLPTFLALVYPPMLLSTMLLNILSVANNILACLSILIL